MATPLPTKKGNVGLTGKIFCLSISLSLSFSPQSLYLSLSRLLVVGIDFRGREIACLAAAAALGPLDYLAEELGVLVCLAAALGPLPS